jgi:hypothetical protein
MVEWDAIPIQKKQRQYRTVPGKPEYLPSYKERMTDIFSLEGKIPDQPAVKNHH